MARQIEQEANIRDYLLGLDDLQRPKVIDMSIIAPNEWNSAILLVSRLLLMKKGTYPDHPDLGIDIRARYKFAFESDLITLQSEIQEQLSKYLPELAYTQVGTFFKEINSHYYVVISITVNQIAYNIFYDINKETLVGLEEMG